MQKRTILAVPAICFRSVIIVCLLGIGIGTFFDLDISRALAVKTQIGQYFAIFSPTLAYCLLPAGGSCLYAGLKKKSDALKPMAAVILLFSCFMAVYYSNQYFGKHVRPMFGYTPGESPVILSAAGWLLWALLYVWVPFVTLRLLDESDPDKLILVGAALLTSSIAADAVMQWLKQVASRPRYKYLITLENPALEFRNWWQMIPYMAGSNDNYQSWPSGHMSIVGVLYALPVLTDCIKGKSMRKNIAAFALVSLYILLCGYNRIHMTSHFLSDVCFGLMNSYLLTCGIVQAFLRGSAASSPHQ